jgi:hypothetical protein
MYGSWCINFVLVDCFILPYFTAFIILYNYYLFPLFIFLVARPAMRHRGCAMNFLVPAGLGTHLDSGNIDYS